MYCMFNRHLQRHQQRLFSIISVRSLFPLLTLCVCNNIYYSIIRKKSEKHFVQKKKKNGQRNFSHLFTTTQNQIFRQCRKNIWNESFLKTLLLDANILFFPLNWKIPDFPYRHIFIQNINRCFIYEQKWVRFLLVYSSSSLFFFNIFLYVWRSSPGGKANLFRYI